jgi:hypothetical protein
MVRVRKHAGIGVGFIEHDGRWCGMLRFPGLQGLVVAVVHQY